VVRHLGTLLLVVAVGGNAMTSRSGCGALALETRILWYALIETSHARAHVLLGGSCGQQSSPNFPEGQYLWIASAHLADFLAAD
jgi:hypothetical protein